MHAIKRKLLNTTARFVKERDGATAVEFAILAVPFSALLFAIIELAVVFFISSAVHHSMQDAAREVRTGEFQATCGTAAKFKQKVCQKMAGLGNCQNNLRIDVVTSPSGQFEPNLLPPTPTNPDPTDPSKPIILPDTYVESPPGAVVVVRAQYYHPLAMPGSFTRLANQPGNHRLITAATAFRNEPFPSGCS